jgi:Ca2+-binding EF-hand superfamily protein
MDAAFSFPDLVDEVIEHYDSNNDGILDIPEFMASYKDTEKMLNM